MNCRFDHPQAVLRFWRARVKPQLKRQPTPFYFFSVVPIQESVRELNRHFGHLPARHWLSCKTQPLRPLLQWWRKQGFGIEVVSEFEFLAARQEGFPAERILLNGPAKHYWLPRHPVHGLCVNLDSTAEARVLAPLAAKFHWIIGIRLNTREEFDPEAPHCPTQFGITREELVEALKVLKRHQVQPQIVHFHLRTNVASGAAYQRALTEVADICHAVRIAPKYVDCGGGFPPRHVFTRQGKPLDASFNIEEMASVYERALRQFPSAQEIWLENGRWLTAGSGVLVVKVLDVKERRGMRQLICDGGRTLHALVANWEEHKLLSVPTRSGPTCLTTVNGPTCMAFDQLTRRPLPRRLGPGDHLIWLDAGAYHLPWETRFSHGLAAVLWHDGWSVTTSRTRESFAQWWGQWGWK